MACIVSARAAEEEKKNNRSAFLVALRTLHVQQRQRAFYARRHVIDSPVRQPHTHTVRVKLPSPPGVSLAISPRPISAAVPKPPFQSFFDGSKNTANRNGPWRMVDLKVFPFDRPAEEERGGGLYGDLHRGGRGFIQT